MQSRHVHILDPKLACELLRVCARALEALSLRPRSASRAMWSTSYAEVLYSRCTSNYCCSSSAMERAPTAPDPQPPA
eukprot:scaffold190254_cov37-Tisochrysis_lutea.AAC.1